MIDDKPMRLYKYFPTDRWTFFQDLRLRYTPFGAFNDPFEGRPAITGIFPQEQLDEMLLSELKRSVDAQYAGLPDAEKKRISLEQFKANTPTDEVKARVSDFLAKATGSVGTQLLDKLDESLGALCLCEERYNLLMWAHYAQSHEGFQIEFNPNLFDQTKPGTKNNGTLLRVRYQERRPSGFLDRLPTLDILLSKSSHWSYEREWRVLRALNEAAITKPGTPYSICLFDIPPEAVTGVVFGARMSAEIEEKIRSAIKGNSDLSHVRLFRAEADLSHYFLNYVQV